MTQTKLRNIFLQNWSEENRIHYTKQRKKRYYKNLDEKSAIDNKLFWKSVKPLLPDKVAGKDIIHLIENNGLVKTDLETAKVLNNLFFQYSTES